MNRTLLFTLIQVALAASVVYMAVLVDLPLFGYASLAIFFTATISAQIAPEKCGRLRIWAWIGTLPALAALYLKLRASDSDDYFAVLSTQIALAGFITGNRPGAEFKSHWNLLGVFWMPVSAGFVPHLFSPAPHRHPAC
jgi:hypothetical protein